MSEIGSNSIAAEKLKSIIDRAERLLDEKKGIADDIRDVFAEAKSAGLDPKTIRAIIKLRALDAATRDEQDAILHAYMRAIGMIPSEA